MSTSKDREHLRPVDEKIRNTRDQLPKLVAQIHDNALSRLSSSLEGLFTACDDLFFDLSSRASSNNEQSLYFESMREVRVQKQGVINAFKRIVSDNFRGMVAGNLSAKSEPSSADEPSLETLSLVQNDDLEQNVAISNMVNRAQTLYQEQLYALTMRLDHLLSSIEVTEESNPLYPQLICNAFAEACKPLDINIKPRIIIFKQFERHVLQQLGHIYSSANSILIETGILPKIPRNMRSAKGATTPNSEMPQGQLGEQNQDLMQAAYQASFSELSNLLASARGMGIPPIPNYIGYSSNPGPVMASPELISLLSEQQSLPEYREQSEELDLRNLISQLLSRRQPQQPQALKQADDDVINLVAMFFDFILDDRTLPLAVQAQISRLQIPIVKVALRDSSFFNNTNHPARKLINAIANAGVGLDESKPLDRDPIFKKISEIVHEINEQQTEDSSSFDQMLSELNQVSSKEAHKSSLIEKRTSEAETGKAKTQKAKEVSQTLLFEKLQETQLPQEISEFLTKTWLQVLIITCLKHGEDSQPWIDASQAADDLIWASKSHSNPKSLERLERLKPDLMERLRQGLEAVSNGPEELLSHIEKIESTLTRAKDGSIEADDYHELNEAQEENLGRGPNAEKPWKEMTALQRQQAKYKALTYEFIKRAEELPPGTWLSYQDHQSGKVLRCKLATKLDITDTYVFVNRFGFKALEKQRKDFAYDMQQGRAIPLESGPLFERAMEKISLNLRQANASDSGQ